MSGGSDRADLDDIYMKIEALEKRLEKLEGQLDRMIDLVGDIVGILRRGE